MFLKITDPKATAEKFATIDTAKSKQMLDAESGRVSRDRRACDALKSTLTVFQKTLLRMQEQGSTIRYSATLSDAQFATVKESAGLHPGVYQFYVESLATAGQLAITVPPGIDAGTLGKLKIKVGDSDTPPISIDLAGAGDKDGKVSPESLARAINRDAKGGVRAEVVGKVLQVSATRTGKSGQLTLITEALLKKEGKAAKADGPAQFVNAFKNAKVTAQAKDAVFYLGSDKNGERIEQTSNTLSSIKGLRIEFKQVGKSGTVTIAADNGKTENDVNAFTEAYNALGASLRKLIRAGDPAKNEAGGPFSADAGVRGLVSEVTRLLNEPVGGIHLHKVGISIDRYGTMSVDSAQLRKMLETDGSKLNSLFGDKTSGLLGRLNTVLAHWTEGTTGNLKRREDAAVTAERTLAAKREDWARRYASLYDRYTHEFTRLKIMQANMDRTLSQFKGMFSTGAE